MNDLSISFKNLEELEAARQKLEGASKLGLGMALGENPPINILKSANGATIKALIPGIEPGTLLIKAVDRKIEIKGFATQKKQNDPGYYIHKESAKCKLYRLIELPFLIDSKKMQLSFENGILSITAPKPEIDNESQNLSSIEFQRRLDTIYTTIKPKSDIYEIESSYLLMLKMPGVKFEDTEYCFEEDTLTVTGLAKELSPSCEKLVYSEFAPTSYKRKFKFARPIDKSSITTFFENGVLSLSITKK